MPAAISGSGGHPATLAAARALWHGFELDDAAAMTLLREFNARCLPPWTERELARKLAAVKAHAYTTARGHLRQTHAMPRPPRRTVAPPPPAPETATWKIERRSAPPPPALAAEREPAAPEPSEASALPAAIPPPLDVPVPGCMTPRPAGLDLPDADWRAVEAAGMASEPLMLTALTMFGPGCRIVESEAGE